MTGVSRSFFTTLALSALALAGMLGAAPSARAGDSKPCTAQQFHFPAVEAACKQGGQKAVKELMKGATKKAKAAGKSFKCKSCHADTKSWALTDDAVEALRPWL